MVPLNCEKTGKPPSKLLVFGCGYLGIRVAARSLCAGHVVWATTRRPQRLKPLRAAGIEPLIADWNDRRTLERLPEVDRVVIAVSYDRNSPYSRVESQVGGLRRLLSVLPEKTDICYISTTGVYHQQGGLWVDETSPTRPLSAGGKAHLQGESLLRKCRGESKWTILRLAGIYGPGRVPRAADVIAGREIASPAEAFLNLIHVDDAAAAINACWQSSRRRLYVIADDQPVSRGDFYREIAHQCSAPEPIFVPPPQGADASQRGLSDKRVWNRRMRRDLVPRLRFPSYREGLRDVLA